MYIFDGGKHEKVPANVVPVFKKGNTSLAANYRPISLTCVSCKIMEHIITSNVMRHASTHNILQCCQLGSFRMRENLIFNG